MRDFVGGVFIPLLDQEPGVLFALLELDESELPMKPGTRKDERDVPFGKPLEHRLLTRARVALEMPALLVGSFVPDHDRSRAVVPFRDDALEGTVSDRMILD